jgi:hypothetical protein
MQVEGTYRVDQYRNLPTHLMPLFQAAQDSFRCLQVVCISLLRGHLSVALFIGKWHVRMRIRRPIWKSLF